MRRTCLPELRNLIGPGKSFSGTVSSASNLRFAFAPASFFGITTADEGAVLYEITLPGTSSDHVSGQINAPMAAFHHYHQLRK